MTNAQSGAASAIFGFSSSGGVLKDPIANWRELVMIFCETIQPSPITSCLQGPRRPDLGPN